MKKLLLLFLFVVNVLSAQTVNTARMLSGVNTQTGTTYTMQAIDSTRLTTFSNSSSVAVTLPSGSTSGFGRGTLFSVRNLGAGTVTITCSGCTIDGGATLVLVSGAGADIYSAGGNYNSNKGSAGGGGSQTPLNAFQKSNGSGGFTSSSAGDDGTSLINPLLFQQNADAQFKGPNPSIDARAYGVRAVNPNVLPATPGITATCNGTSTVTLSQSWPGVNGDGVAIYGCGPNNPISTPSAPTVTPSNDMSLSNVLLDTNSATGATTWQYAIRAWGGTNGMAVTALSPITIIVNGQATLGPVTVNISSITISNNIWTVTTSSPHGMGPGTSILLSGNTSTYNGYFAVNTVPDNTHFTIKTSKDTRNGAVSTVPTVGTVTYINNNRIQVSAATGSANGTKYPVYRCPSSGTCAAASMVLIGVTLPQNSTFIGEPTYLAFEDYGPTFTVAPALPFYIPTTGAAGASADALLANINSGAGTSTLTLSVAASQIVSGKTIVLDDGQNLAAASVAATSQSAKLILPVPTAGTGYIINSPTTLATSSQLEYYSNLSLFLYDTLTIPAVTLDGQITAGMGAASFANYTVPTIAISRAYPGLYVSGNANAYIKNVGFTGPESCLLFLQDGNGQVGASSFDHVQWNMGGNGYTSMAQIFRATHVSGLANLSYENNVFTAGNGLGLGSMRTPSVYWSNTANPFMKFTTLSGKGFLFDTAGPGTFFISDWMYSQGNYTPFVSVINPQSGGNSSAQIRINNPIFDTTLVPLVSYFDQPTSTASVAVYTDMAVPNSANLLTGGPNMALITGVGTLLSSAGINSLSFATQPFAAAALDELFNVGVGGSTGALVPQLPLNASLQIGQAFGAFSLEPAPAAPTCATVAAGPPFTSAGTWFFKWAVKEGNGAMGNISLPSSSCTANGTTQQILVTLPSNPYSLGQGGYVMASTSQNSGYQYVGNTDPTTAAAAWNQSTLTYTFPGVNGNTAATQPAAGSAGIGNNTAYGYKVSVGGTTSTSPDNTAPRTAFFPDNSGYIPVTSYLNSVYDNANRSNGAIGANYNVITSHGINVTSNQFQSTGSANNIAYWSNSKFSPLQFAQATVTVTNGTGTFQGVTVLTSGTTGTDATDHAYDCIESTNLLALQLINGVGSSTLQSSAVTGSAGDVLRLEANNGTLTCTQIAVSGTITTLTATDTTYTTGQPGMFFFGNTLSLDNWSGGNLHPIAQFDQEQDWTKTQHFNILDLAENGGTVFANLPSATGIVKNGMVTYCPDCTIANPCAGSGTGAIAKRLNGVWVCN